MNGAHFQQIQILAGGIESFVIMAYAAIRSDELRTLTGVVRI
jgi:hypothetical protein